ncbi:hypothetical protein EVAR_101190_1, partial [Eumeta japonica]
MNIINRINWLRFKKYLSSHCSESIQLRTPGDVELSIQNFTKMTNQAVDHASTAITSQVLIVFSLQIFNY